MENKVSCESCGMPIQGGKYCQYCVDEKGNLQSFETRFEKMVQWVLSKEPTTPRAEAEKRTHENANSTGLERRSKTKGVTTCPVTLGRQLPKKLGIKPPLTLVAIDAPQEYRSWLGELPAGVRIISKASKSLEAAHLFVTKRAALKKSLVAFRKQLEQTGFVWVSWPKKASKVEITEDVIREVALPLGLVDIKVCAVSEVWSGLKLVIRKSERTA